MRLCLGAARDAERARYGPGLGPDRQPSFKARVHDLGLARQTYGGVQQQEGAALIG